ncbi:MAG: sulfotransferase [Pseudomonadota bacterium]
MSTYLFVLCPPYCGSTLLWKLLSTSEKVSSLPQEGQFLDELKHVTRVKQWDISHSLPWPHIKAVWETYWDMDKPILLEKSPPNLVRAPAIQEHFQPSRFVIMVRDPYAHAEGLMRRNGWKLQRAARFVLTCLRYQWRNREQLTSALALTYEDLVTDPISACRRVAEFMPILNDLNPHTDFELDSIDGTVTQPITDLNQRKIAAIEPQHLQTMTEIFAEQADALEAWGYSLRSTP